MALELTAANLGYIFSQSLIFASIGAVISTAQIFIDRKRGKKLCIPTKFIQTDIELLILCNELQTETRDKNIGIDVFGQLIRGIDQLVGLQFTLQSIYMRNADKKEYHKDMSQTCSSLLAEIIINFRKLKEKSVEKLSDKCALQVIYYCNKIFKEKIHWYVSSCVEMTDIFQTRATQRIIDYISTKENKTREEVKKQYDEFCKREYDRQQQEQQQKRTKTPKKPTPK